MALTYNDLNFVTQSARSLDDTLTNRRRERQQQGQFDEDMAMRRHLLQRQLERDQEQLGLQRDQLNLSTAFQQEGINARKEEVQYRRQQEQAQQARQLFGQIQDLFKNSITEIGTGTDTPEEKAAKLRAFRDALPEEMQKGIDSLPAYRQIQEGKFDWSQFTKAAPKTQDPASVAEAKYADELRAKASQLEQSGNASEAKRIRAQADRIDGSAVKPPQLRQKLGDTGSVLETEITGPSDEVMDWVKQQAKKPEPEKKKPGFLKSLFGGGDNPAPPPEPAAKIGSVSFGNLGNQQPTGPVQAGAATISAPPIDLGNGATMQKTIPEAPRDAKQRKAGTSYMTPKGILKWTGTGWIQP